MKPNYFDACGEMLARMELIGVCKRDRENK